MYVLIAAIFAVALRAEAAEMGHAHVVTPPTVLVSASPATGATIGIVNLAHPAAVSYPLVVGSVSLVNSPTGCNGYTPSQGSQCTNPAGLYDCYITGTVPASAMSLLQIAGAPPINQPQPLLSINYPNGAPQTLCTIEVTGKLNANNIGPNNQIVVNMRLDNTGLFPNGSASVCTIPGQPCLQPNQEPSYIIQVVEPPSFPCSVPSSIEVCLSKIFESIEIHMKSIVASLSMHEKTIKMEMHHEHTLLFSQVDHVKEVKLVAHSVEEYVSEEYEYLKVQISDLKKEKIEISDIYSYVIGDLKKLEAAIKEVELEEKDIVKKHEKIIVAKWTLYSEISAIQAEKVIIKKEEGEIEEVVEKLAIQVNEIYEKLEQLNKRGVWLEDYEVKLVAYLSALKSDIQEFRSIQSSLHVREDFLYNFQESLLKKVDSVESCMEYLKIQYSEVHKQIEILQVYEKQVQQYEKSVSLDASAFTSAYEDFTCEDSLLSYEACSKPAAAPLAIAAKPPV